jgi:signal transduction histidine kinase/ligand-binding sensor domain-containing protein
MARRRGLDAAPAPMTPRESRTARLSICHRVAVAAAIAVFVCLAGSRPSAEDSLPDYVLSAWGNENGLKPGDVFAVAQDVDGYLWLGTPNGLIRFDGSRFTPWTALSPENPLPSGPVHAIVGSADGSLWVGIGGGAGVVRVYQGKVYQHAKSDGAPPGANAMIQDRQGTIWVGTRSGVFRFANSRWTVMGKAQGYSGAEAFSLYEDRAGRVWFGTASGVYRRNGEMLELVDAGATNVQSLTEDATGAIWVTDSRDIVRKLSTHAAPQHEREIRLPAGAWRLLRDSHNQIWIAAFGGGLLRVRSPLDPSPLVERFEYEHRLAGSPRSLFEDREGNIWVGMRGGLIRLSTGSFSNLRSLEGLTNDGVRTATVGADGSVWVATGHALNRFSGSSRTSYDVAQTMALHSDRHGTLWVASGQSVSRLAGNRLQGLTLPDTIRSSRIMALTTDAQDTLWLCTALKGLMTWNGKVLSRFEDQADLTNKACQSIFTDSQGRVWIGLLTAGAAVFDGGKFRFFGEHEGLPRGTVLAITEDRRGGIWLSTTTGLSRFHNGRLTAITQANAPLADLVPVLIEDAEGYIWVGVNSGAAVIRFHPTEADRVGANPAHQLEYALYDETDGMQQGSQTWQAGVGGVRDIDGRLWVATGLGMTVIDPRNLPLTRRPPPPRIESVTADGRTVTPGRDLALPSGTSTLRIDYGTVSLNSAAKLRFRYMLEGMDDEWVYAGSTREATYTNVPSGNYLFRVSTTANGEWTEAARWAFSVAPPFYRTPSFITLALVGTLLLLAAAWYLRLRAVRNQFTLVFAERARVSREIHDTLLQSLAAIGVELETLATELDSSQTPAREGLRRLRRQVGHCLREARESILELRNNSMKPRALVDSLRDLAENTTRSKGVTTEFLTTGRPQCSSADAEMQLLRIAQESVRNAVRHGRATQVQIALRFEDDRILLRVSDDGRGFVPDEHEAVARERGDNGEHLGLLTMRERAARVRGHIDIISSPGRGTTIETSVPVMAE